VVSTFWAGRKGEGCCSPEQDHTPEVEVEVEVEVEIEIESTT
jgi:hypothetical protein